MLPFEIRAIVPSYFNDYAVRRDFPLTAFSTCTPLCRRAKICLYLRHRAFRSEQSRHGWKDYYRSFALTKNSKYVKMRPPGKAGRPSEWNNTANAGRIVSKPKRQEDSSCVFAYRFYRGTCHRRDAAEKRKSAEHTSAQVKKKSHQKAVGTIRQENRQGRGKLPHLYAAVRVRRRSCRIRIPDPLPGGSQDTGGAFRSRVQRPGVRHRSIGAGRIRPMWLRTDLAQVKRDRHTGRP